MSLYHFLFSLMKLDMVVRDENGNALDPKSTSTIELFRQHQKSTHKLRKNVVSNVLNWKTKH